MYRIIGTDGKEYGPISAEQLRQWLGEGRVSGATRVCGADNNWKTLAQFPEFASSLPASAPPPPLGRATVTMTPSAAVTPRTSLMAVLSLALGILGLFTCGTGAVAGLILGIIAQVKIKKSQGQLMGTGLAVAGICVSAATFFLMIFVMAGLLLPALAKAKEKAQTALCINHVKQLAVGARMYAADNNDQFPTAAKWCDAISTNVNQSAFQCPLDPGARCAYAFNPALSGKKTDEVNFHTVMFFESNAGWNGTGSREAMATGRHSSRGGEAVVVGYADGSVEIVPASRLDALRWNP